MGEEQWDLTSRVSPYLDRHMMFPLLEFLDTLISNKQIGYSAEQVQTWRLALLRPTRMTDYAMDSVGSGDPELVAELEKERSRVIGELETVKQGCSKLLELTENEEQLTKLQTSSQWNAANLLQNHGISKDMVETYRKLARLKYDCGDYKASRDMLTLYIALFARPPAASESAGDEDEFLAETGAVTAASSNNTNSETGNASMYYLQSVDNDMLQVLWGKLAGEIMAQDWEAATKAVDAVRTAIESMAGSTTNASLTPLQALQQRTWLLHWALFVYWNNSANGLEHLVELFTTDRYRQAITTHAPHLLRYLTAAVLLCKRRKKSNNNNSATVTESRRLMRNLVYVMQDVDYTDPIVDFVNSLLVKFNFDLAQTKLAECLDVLKTDFFLCQQCTLFMEEARVFLFENYCRIHHKIDLKALGFKFLAMDPIEAERWMVDLIRSSDVLQGTAKVMDNDCVVMEMEPQSIYEQVMDRTRDLNVRTATLAQSLQNRLSESRKEQAKRERVGRD